jgi:hypothetical protein
MALPILSTNNDLQSYLLQADVDSEQRFKANL